MTMVDKFNEPFPSRLRALMAEAKVTQTELANYIGIARQSVSQYTDGSSQPVIGKLIEIAKYFDVSADYLLGLSNVRSHDESIKTICAKTGLSEKSVSRIIYYRENAYDVTEFLNNIIERTSSVDIEIWCGKIHSIHQNNQTSDHNPDLFERGQGVDNDGLYRLGLDEAEMLYKILLADHIKSVIFGKDDENSFTYKVSHSIRKEEVMKYGKEKGKR